ncbi:MFS transporter [Brevibacillus daliensis]|uniref:MFS transporter n=1 Tax=Brevibacillus daliensis TaxID=2892995 RepID=UPI00210281AC|nr:MFS transporter [Brevibacillus daliensis]
MNYLTGGRRIVVSSLKNIFTFHFTILFLSRIVSKLGDWIYLVVISLIIAEHNPAWIPLLFLMKITANFVFSFIAGSIVDRLGPKFTSISSDIGRAFAIALMPFFLDSYILFLLVFIDHMLSTFFSAALTPILTKTTTKENRHTANSLMEMIVPFSQFIGPFIGTLLLLINQAFSFYIQSITFILSAFSLIFIPYRDDVRKGNPLDGYKKSIAILCDDIMFAGRYLWENHILKNTTLAMTLFILGSTVIDAYEVLYITRTLGLQEEYYAIIISFGGVAYFISTLSNVLLSQRLGLHNLFFVGLLLSILGNVIFVLATNVPMLMIALILMAIGGTPFFVTIFTVMQNIVPIEYQGRVSSIQDVLPSAAAIVATAVSSLFFYVEDLRIMLIISACVMFLATIPGFFAYRGMKDSHNSASSLVDL